MKTTPDTRVIFKDQFDGMAIIIPSKKYWMVLIVPVLVIGFWWITWGAFSLGGLHAGPSESTLNWFWLLWGAMLGLVILRNLWQTMASKEVIDVNSTELLVKNRAKLFAKPKKYQLAEASHFRAEESKAARGSEALFEKSAGEVEGAGTIAFDYGLKTVRFGEDLSLDEARYILQILKEKQLLSERYFVKE